MCLYLDDEVGLSKGTFDFVNHIFVATDDTLYVHEIFWWEYLKNETLTCIKGQFSKNEAFWLIIYWRLVHYQSLVTRLVCYKEFGVSLGFLFSSYSRVTARTMVWFFWQNSDFKVWKKSSFSDHVWKKSEKSPNLVSKWSELVRKISQKNVWFLTILVWKT